MTSLFEIVFENIERKFVPAVISKFIGCADEVVSIQTDHQTPYFSKNSPDKFTNKLIESDKYSYALLTLKNMRVGKYLLSLVGLRMIKYENLFDVDVNFDFDTEDKREISLIIKSWHEYSINLSKEFDIKFFFGGMEPASDKDTRYFSNEKAGPCH